MQVETPGDSVDRRIAGFAPDAPDQNGHSNSQTGIGNCGTFKRDVLPWGAAFLNHRAPIVSRCDDNCIPGLSNIGGVWIVSQGNSWVPGLASLAWG
jgi:hypothetical protein